MASSLSRSRPGGDDTDAPVETSALAASSAMTPSLSSTSSTCFGHRDSRSSIHNNIAHPPLSSSAASSQSQHSHFPSPSAAPSSSFTRPSRPRSSSKSNHVGKTSSANYYTHEGGGGSKFEALFGNSSSDVAVSKPVMPPRASTSAGVAVDRERRASTRGQSAATTQQPPISSSYTGAHSSSYGSASRRNLNHRLKSPQYDDSIVDPEMDRLIDEEDAQLAAAEESASAGGLSYGGRKEILRCERCHKVYHHPQSLIKHRWQHTTHWTSASSFGMSKHQTVQALEAAVMLANADTGAWHHLPEDKSHWPAAVSPPTSGLLGSDRINLDVLRRKAQLNNSNSAYSQSVPARLMSTTALNWGGRDESGSGSRTKGRSRKSAVLGPSSMLSNGRRRMSSRTRAAATAPYSVPESREDDRISPDDDDIELDLELEEEQEARERDDELALSTTAGDDDDDDGTEDEDDAIDLLRSEEMDHSLSNAADAMSSMHLASSPYFSHTALPSAPSDLDHHARGRSSAKNSTGPASTLSQHLHTQDATHLSASAPVLGFFEDSLASESMHHLNVEGIVIVPSPSPSQQLIKQGEARQDLSSTNQSLSAHSHSSGIPISVRSPVLAPQLLGGHSPRLPSSLGRAYSPTSQQPVVSLGRGGVYGASFGQAPLSGSYRASSLSRSIGQVLHSELPKTAVATEHSVKPNHQAASVGQSGSSADDDDLQDMELE